MVRPPPHRPAHGGDTRRLTRSAARECRTTADIPDDGGPSDVSICRRTRNRMRRFAGGIAAVVIYPGSGTLSLPNRATDAFILASCRRRHRLFSDGIRWFETYCLMQTSKAPTRAVDRAAEARRSTHFRAGAASLREDVLQTVMPSVVTIRPVSRRVQVSSSRATWS